MPWNNHFLDSLGEVDVCALEPELTRIELPRDQLLDEPGRPIMDVYLPVSCILSVLTVMKDGSQVESRTIGHESGYGLLNALGSPVAYERMQVQVAGQAWGIPLEALGRAARDSASLTEVIVRHAQATILQAAQSTACNTLHRAEQRLCRSLLLTQDRLGMDLLPLTQEHLAVMLGVQRTTVTAVAVQLQERGAISYSRGKIRMLDRAMVERCSCECYAAIERGVEMMLEHRGVLRPS